METQINEKIEELENELVKDFCNIVPYRDTELKYWKGFIEKEYNLIPTVRQIMEFYRESVHEIFNWYIQQKVEEIEKMKINGISPQIEQIKYYNSGIRDAQANLLSDIKE